MYYYDLNDERYHLLCLYRLAHALVDIGIGEKARVTEPLNRR